MADTGWLTAGSARNHPIGSNPDWTSPGSAKVSDNAWSYCSMPASSEGDGLNLYNFGVAIPPGNTVLGIEAKIERHGQTTDTIKDAYVYLMDDTNTKGNSKADTVNYWPSSDAWKSYGSSSDLWGASWTRAQVNVSTFGIALVPKNYYGAQKSAYCDCMQVKIYYGPTGSDHLMMMGM